MNEPKERPDEPGIWQCRDDKLLVALKVGNDLRWTDYPEGIVFHLPVARPTGDCRLIIDAAGKRVCDPQSGWPAEPKAEQRRLVVYGGGACVRLLPVMSLAMVATFADIILDEIRSCEVDDVGRVVKILPAEEK